MPEIYYCSKEQLYPKFGFAVPSKQVAYVRDDLPKLVKELVTSHELYHLRDRSKWRVRREMKANIAGAHKHPMGFAICALMCLAPYRLRYYWRRIAGKDEQAVRNLIDRL